MPTMDPLRSHVIELLRGGHAHADLETAFKSLPAKLRGKKPKDAEHTPWQLLEHIRIATWDILEFSRNPNHVSPSWPRGYWPPAEVPPSASAWNKSLGQVREDLKAMEQLVTSPKTDLLAKIPHGDGQTILREALLLADHNAYHVGQVVLLRRLLNAWKG
jgi:hypothetical protein